MKRTPLKPGKKPLRRKTPLKPGNNGLKKTGFKKPTLEQVKEKQRKQRVSSKSRGGGLSDKWMERADKLWRKLIPLMWDNRCAMCGRPLLLGEGHCHHIISRSVKLFRHESLNGIYLCPLCHGHDPKAPHVSPVKFREWLGAEYPVLLEWLKDHQGQIDSGKPDYEAICRQLEEKIAEYS